MANFDDACMPLLMSQPFFSQLLLKMEVVETEAIPTACVTPSKLMYNPQFFEKLDLDEATFVIAHEIMHLAWQHLPRLRAYLDSGVGPDGKELNPKLFNMALDYPINHSLVVAKIGKPIDAAKGLQICLDPSKYPETAMPEDIYCDLVKNPPKGGAGAMDEHDPGEPGEKQAVTPADVIQAAEQHKRIRGEYPAGIERLLGAIKKPDHSPWALLRQFITTSLPGHDATTWRRLQRRYIVRGIGMPGSVSNGAGRIGLVVDTSGSIGDEMLALFAGHMAAIMADARPQDVVVYWTDADVHSREVIKTPTQLRAYLQKGALGGGGTDMPVGVAAAEEDKCDAVVVLTDGYTPFCDSKKPLMWAITSHNISAPFGKTIHI